MPQITYTFKGAGAGSVKTQLRDVDGAAKRAADNQGKRAKKLLRNRARNRLKRIREAKKAATAEVKIAEKAAKDVAKAEQKAESKTERRRRKLRRNRARNRLKQIKTRERDAKKLASLRKRTEKDERTRSKKRRSAISGAAFGVAGAAAGAIIGATAAVGGAAVRQQVTLEEKSRSLAVQARGAGEKAKDPKQITADAQRVALDVGGTTAESVIDAMTTFVTRTGKFEMAEAMAETFAVAAKATGASADEIAGAAADLFEKFDIKTVEDMQAAFAALTFQGKKGAFELKDAASQFPKLAAAASRLGGFKGVQGVRELGGLTQIARSSTGSAEAAATSLEAVFTGLTTKQKELKKAGVKVFDKEGQARPIKELLTDVVSKVGGKDVAAKKGELAKIFGRQGIRALSPLISAYADATGDAAAKQEAVAQALNEAIDAPGTWNDVIEDAAIMNESLSSQLTTAWESIVAASGGTLTPAIMDLAGALTTFLTEGGGLEGIAFAFDVVAENARFLADVLGEVANFLELEGPGTDKVIKREQRTQEQLNKRIEAAKAAKEPILERARKGTMTEKDVGRLGELDTQIEGFIKARGESKAREKAAVDKREAPFEEARAAGTGKVTDTPFFTKESFAKEFAKAGGFVSKLESEAGFGGPFTSSEDAQAAHATAVAEQLARGETVPTLGYTEAQQNLINEVGGQVQALSKGVGAEQAPADAIGMDLAPLKKGFGNLGVAAAAAALKLKAVAAEGGDIG